MFKKEKIIKILMLFIGLISIIQLVIRVIKGVLNYGWLISIGASSVEIAQVPWGIICLLFGMALPFKKVDKKQGKSLLISGIISLFIMVVGITTISSFFEDFWSVIISMWMIMPLLMIALFAFSLYIIKSNKDRKKAKILLLIAGILSLSYEAIFLFTFVFRIGVLTLPSLIILSIGILFGIGCCFTAKKYLK